MQAIIDAIKAEEAAIKAEAEKRWHRIMEASKTANNGLAPTVDCNGRWHAPCDGYEFEDDIYGAGEFLKMPEKDLDYLCYIMGFDSYGSASSSGYKEREFTVRVKTTKAAAEAFEAAVPKLMFVKSVKTGAAWGDGQCYAYIKCSRLSTVKVIEEAAKASAVPAVKSSVVLVDGRQELTGVILNVLDPKPDAYTSHANPAPPRLVIELLGGGTLFGNLTSGFEALATGPIRTLMGKQVKFTAELVVNKKDASKASYKRPTKVEKYDSSATN